MKTVSLCGIDVGLGAFASRDGGGGGGGGLCSFKEAVSKWV